VFNGKAGDGSALHLVAKAPNGHFLDISGDRSKQDLIEQYEMEGDDGERVYTVEADSQNEALTLAECGDTLLEETVQTLGVTTRYVEPADASPLSLSPNSP
jgi:hypothetical protein